ncbi:inactive serine protease PAMR1-like isoform X2 [Hemitrygon akajei]|uniref:inactive serine protease PAMR1-like isoform X2 n=1 Tax=Hemitrygon akajei TaxID=2704970 RepID=UPI003BF98F14
MLAWVALSLLLLQIPGARTLPKGYTLINEDCPGAEWNIMCRECCETDQIECTCPGKQDVVGYSVPCCRNEENECDSCLIHPGCIIFDNCKKCNNGSWGTLDDFYIKGVYCSECHTGWSGGDCLKCGAVMNASRGHIILEGYPSNSHCEWMVSVNPNFAIELRFSMLSLEFDYMCQYDYVEVRDGDNVDSRVIGKFCGNERPPPIRTTGNMLHVLFVSDGYKSFDGFYATFEEVDVPESRRCADPGAPINGHRRVLPGSGYLQQGYATVGTIVEFTCNSSFALSGSPQASCQRDGTWSAKQATCGKERKHCAIPGAPLNGHWRILPGSGHLLHGYATLGTVVQFTCNYSFVLRGSPQARCQQDGTWSEKLPTCRKVPEVKHCSDPGVPMHGHRKIIPGSGKMHQGHAILGTIVRFTCNYSFVLSGSPQITCQKDGTWTETRPRCIKACKQPKLPNLVKQKVLSTQPQTRRTPLHRLLATILDKEHSQISPTKAPVQHVGNLPSGFYHPHTQLEYECISPFYRRLGSRKRTCLKTGKWSGRSPLCIPICGKLGNFSRQNLASIAWPWQAALYQKVSQTSNEIVSGHSWFLACSGAVLNERSVVVAAHCVTELGKAALINTADLMVVLGKYFYDEAKQEESRQYLQIAGVIVHPSYDPVLLDSDIAIIKLMDKAKITNQVQPVCLPDLKDLSAISAQGYVTGWRIQSEPKESSRSNDTLRVGTVEIGDAVQCEQQYEEHGISVSITENMFCARQDPQGFSNICPLETGGVATFPAADKAGEMFTWYLVGLVSWGYESECSQELFTVYTSVAPFKDWIEKHLK